MLRCGQPELPLVAARSGETYQGIHEPVIPASLFTRVQDIKSGRCGPKVTKHSHLFRGLFRCGLCDRPMSPELQKGRVYYRCQGQECATKTVREDVLDRHICAALKKFELSECDAENLVGKWNTGLDKLTSDDLRKSLKLRIYSTEQSLSRAADLLIDGTLDNETYLAKKRKANLALIALKEELQNLPNLAEIKENNAHFIELMKNLTGLYEALKPAEKRVFVENTFSNRTVNGKKPCVLPYSWVQTTQNGEGVPFGDPYRHTDRTFGVPKELKRLFELFF